MKRYMRGFVAAIVSLGFMGGVASAQETPACDGALVITNTGPGSTNEIKCVDSTTIHVTCSNNIYVVNDNSQSGGSGDADNSGNTTGGGSITGNATNENGATVEIGAECGAQPAVVTPEAPESPTPSQPVGGMGAGAPAAAAAITELPNTGSNTLVDSILIGGAGLTTLLVASRLGAVAYRRFALR